MKQAYFRLTKSESEIMDLMWKEGRPLSRSEIIDLTPDRSWKPASIHILLNSMLDKGASRWPALSRCTQELCPHFYPYSDCR